MYGNLVNDKYLYEFRSSIVPIREHSLCTTELRPIAMALVTLPQTHVSSSQSNQVKVKAVAIICIAIEE